MRCRSAAPRRPAQARARGGTPSHRVRGAAPPRDRAFAFASPTGLATFILKSKLFVSFSQILLIDPAPWLPVQRTLEHFKPALGSAVNLPKGPLPGADLRSFQKSAPRAGPLLRPESARAKVCTGLQVAHKRTFLLT